VENHICLPLFGFPVNWKTALNKSTLELRRQQNGALGMKAFNGLVVLEVRQVMSAEAHPLQHQRNPM